MRGRGGRSTAPGPRRVDFERVTSPTRRPRCGGSPSRGGGGDVRGRRPTGGGKSTLVRLLLRFIDASGGRSGRRPRHRGSPPAACARHRLVAPGRLPHRRHDRREHRLRRDRTAAEEIVRGRAAGRGARLRRGAAGGYDTLVGERGMQLSGGQRQRLRWPAPSTGSRRCWCWTRRPSAVDTETEARDPEIARAHRRRPDDAGGRPSVVDGAPRRQDRRARGRPGGREGHARAARRYAAAPMPSCGACSRGRPPRSRSAPRAVREVAARGRGRMTLREGAIVTGRAVSLPRGRPGPMARAHRCAFCNPRLPGYDDRSVVGPPMKEGRPDERKPDPRPEPSSSAPSATTSRSHATRTSTPRPPTTSGPSSRRGSV